MTMGTVRLVMKVGLMVCGACVMYLHGVWSAAFFLTVAQIWS